MSEIIDIGDTAEPLLGKIMIEIDLDHERYNVGFSMPQTAQLMRPVEVNNLYSPFHAALLCNEMKRRKGDTVIAKATPKMIIEINDKRNS